MQLSPDAKFAFWNGGFGIVAAASAMIAKNSANNFFFITAITVLIIAIVAVIANPFGERINSSAPFD